MTHDVRRIPPGERTLGAPTPGMTREEATMTDRSWAGFARTDPRMVSGWHHHGDFESVIYVLSGALRMEFGPGGTEVVEGEPGDFVVVERGAIHREGNPTDVPAELVVFRAGSGAAVVNVEGPG